MVPDQREVWRVSRRALLRRLSLEVDGKGHKRRRTAAAADPDHRELAVASGHSMATCYS